MVILESTSSFLCLNCVRARVYAKRNAAAGKLFNVPHDTLLPRDDVDVTTEKKCVFGFTSNKQCDWNSHGISNILEILVLFLRLSEQY